MPGEGTAGDAGGGPEKEICPGITAQTEREEEEGEARRWTGISCVLPELKSPSERRNVAASITKFKNNAQATRVSIISSRRLQRVSDVLLD